MGDRIKVCLRPRHFTSLCNKLVWRTWVSGVGTLWLVTSSVAVGVAGGASLGGWEIEIQAMLLGVIELLDSLLFALFLCMHIAK